MLILQYTLVKRGQRLDIFNVEPYRGAVSEAIVTEPNGQQIHTRLFQQPGHSEGFVNIEPILRERGVHQIWQDR